MFFKYVKVFFRTQSRLLKFPNASTWNTQIRSLCLNASGFTVESDLEDSGTEKWKFYSSYFKKNRHKYNIVNSENIDLTEETSFKSLILLKDLVKFSMNLNSEENSDCEKIKEELQESIQCEASSYSLNEILKFIILTSKLTNKDNIKTLIEVFSNEICKKRFFYDESLNILFLSKSLLDQRIYRNLKFTKKALYKLLEKIKKLTPEEVVLLFYNLVRLSDELLRSYKFNVQLYLLQLVPKYDFDELTIISKGLISSKITISLKDLPVAIANKIVEELKNPHELSLTPSLKFISDNALLLERNGIVEFQEKMLQHVEKLNVTELMYLANTGVFFGHLNSSLWEILSNAFKKNIKNFSLQEIEKMVKLTFMCNIQDEELLKMTVEEFENHTDSLSSCYGILIAFLYNLIFHQMYPEKLLNLVLSNDFRLKYNPKSFDFNVKYKYCFINSFLEFEKPKSNFEFLNNTEKHKLYTVFKSYSNQNNAQIRLKKFKLKLMFKLIDLYGESSVYKTEVLPHFLDGIIMRFDKDLKAQPIPEEFKLSESDYKKPLNDNHIWLYMKVLSSNQCSEYDKIQNFEIQTEIQQLETCGYVPVLIQENWIVKQDFLEGVINKKVQEVLEMNTVRKTSG